MACTAQRLMLVFAIVGLALVVIMAILGFAVLPAIVNNQIDENVKLEKEETDQYERFKKLPFPLNFSVTFFQVNNPSRVLSGKEYPNVSEIGPIVYSEQFEKHDLQHNGSTITYHLSRTFSFNREYSKVDQSQPMTVVNTPLISTFQIFSKLAHGLPGIVQSSIVGYVYDGYPQAFEMPTDTVFHEVTIDDYAFRGYKFCDPAKTKGAARLLCAILRLKGSPTLEFLPNRVISFAFFRANEGLARESFEVQDGVEDTTVLGNIVKFDGKPRTNWWKEEGLCNNVKGTDATIYGAHNDKDSVFTVFSTNICRSVQLAYTDEIDYMDVPGYRSSIQKDTMDWSLEKNKCYCIGETFDLYGENPMCLPNGFMDMQTCLKSPLILSFPHFLWAEDTNYTQTVTGLNPNEERHKVYVEMEPNTGTPLIGRQRVQLNSVLRPYHKDFKVLNSIKNSLLPLVWIDEHALIPINLIDLLKAQYLTPMNAIDISKWVIIGLGIAMILGCGSMYIYKRKSSKS